MTSAKALLGSAAVERVGPSDPAVRQLIDDVPDGVIFVSPDGIIRYANAAVEPVLGWRPAALVGQSLHMLVPPELRERHRRLHLSYAQRPSPRPMAAGFSLDALRADGELVPVEIALIPLVDPPRWTAGIVRDITQRRRLQQRLAVKGELITLMATGADRATLIERFLQLAAASLLADGVWVQLVDESGAFFELVGSVDPLAAASIPRRGPLAGDPLGEPAGDRVRAVAVPPALEGTAGATYGKALLVTVRSETGGVRGGVTVARAEHRPELDDADRGFVVGIVEILETALDLVEAREARGRHQRMLDRERIARDLHDSVIQRLFAEGLRLEATAEIASGLVAERLRTVAANIDEVMRDIRTTVFDLQSPPAAAGGVREAVLDLVTEVEAASGLRLRVGFDGAVDAAVPAELGQTLLLVLREALTNVVKHAAATSVEVLVGIEDEGLVLEVADDGRGPAGAAEGRGFGLGNLRARATALGGEARLEAGDGARGSRLRWSVPLGG